MNGIDHSDEDVARETFGRLLANEPASGLRADAVVQQGRRIRRRHRARVALPAVSLSVLALAVVAVPTLGDGGGAADPSAPRLSPVAATAALSDSGREAVARAATAGTSSRDAEPAFDASVLTRLRHLVLAPDGEGRPADAIAVSRTSWGSWEARVVGDPDEPPAHVGFGVTRKPGMLTVHPCQDPEFVAGATCTETTLADGSYLTRRGLVEHDGVKTLYASITRDDGTGVFAESTNYAIDEDTRPTPGATVAGKDKPRAGAPQVVREDPVLSLSQLARVVRGLADGEAVATFPLD
jgi:hypothetical protein